MSKTEAFDLSNLDLDTKAEQGAIYVPHHPADSSKKLPMQLFLVGHDSKTYKAAAKRMSASVRSLKEDDDQGREEAACQLLADCTKGWKGVVEGGEEVTFSKEAAKDLYMKYTWLYEQVNRAIVDRSRFF